QGGQLVGVAADDPGALEQEPAPLPGRHVAPAGLEGPPGPADGGVDLGRPAPLHGGHDLAGGRVEDVEGVLGPARRPWSLELRQRWRHDDDVSSSRIALRDCSNHSSAPGLARLSRLATRSISAPCNNRLTGISSVLPVSVRGSSGTAKTRSGT